MHAPRRTQIAQRPEIHPAIMPQGRATCSAPAKSQKRSSGSFDLALHSGPGGNYDPLETGRISRFPELADSVRRLVYRIFPEEVQPAASRHADGPGGPPDRRSVAHALLSN